MAYTTTGFVCDYSRTRDIVVVLGTVDQFDETTPFTDGGIYHIARDEWRCLGDLLEGIRATSFCFGPDDNESFWVVGDRGQVWRDARGGPVKSHLPDSGLHGRMLGQPNEIRPVGDRLYVCGFAGQVYTLFGDTWVHMDDGLAEPAGEADSIDLESIDGTGPANLFTVGSSGLVAHWDGRLWTRVPVVTNVYLARVRCYGPNRIYVVGNQGVFIESDGRRWPVGIIPGAEGIDLSDVILFQDKVYVAAVNQLFVRDARGWSTVDHRLDPDRTTFVRLVIGGGRLWAMGFKRLSSFDGRTWRAHPDPNNR